MRLSDIPDDLIGSIVVICLVSVGVMIFIWRFRALDASERKEHEERELERRLGHIGIDIKFLTKNVKEATEIGATSRRQQQAEINELREKLDWLESNWREFRLATLPGAKELFESLEVKPKE